MSDRIASVIAAFATVAALVAGIVFGTYTAGGSDSSCYLNTARLLARGRVGLEQPLAREATWPLPGRTFAPAGFTPSPADAAFLVPICSPGLPLVMAVFRRLHVSEFLVVPLLGSLAVWLTFMLGRAIDRPAAGAAAAVLVAGSPTFLYQVVQPMSDVPAAAWWLLAIVCVIGRTDQPGRPESAGVAASIALLTRPNLLPLAFVLGLYLFVTGARAHRIDRIARFAAALVPGILVLALLQRAMYGSPLATGYGSVGSLMGVGHVLPNLRRYLEWLIGAHTPFLVLALAAPAVVREPGRAWLCLAIAGATLGCYLPYLVFDDWWYTRFLLPAIPLIIALSAATFVSLAARLAARASALASHRDGRGIRRRMQPDSHHGLLRNGRRWVGIMTALGVTALLTITVGIAWTRQAFDLAALEQHFYRAGRAVADRISGTAIIVTVKDSGTVQYHGGLPIVSWDTLEADSLEPALALARARGYRPYLLLEIDEEAAFRERFTEASLIGRLDWPPRVQVGRGIRLYDPNDRDQFVRDGIVRTEFIRDTPIPSRDWRRWFRFERD